MTTDHSLNDILQRARSQFLARLDPVLAPLSRATDSFGLTEQAAEVERLLSDHANSTFKVMVFGRFNVGKSSFLNALMNSTAQVNGIGGDLGILPVDYLPSTPVLARIRHADAPKVVANLIDGGKEGWTFDEFLTTARLFNDANLGSPEQATSRADCVSVFDIGLPVDILRNGVEFIDSPGIGEAEARNSITLAEGRNTHAGVFVLRNDNFIGQDELATLEMILAHVGKVFVLSNRFANVDEVRFSKALADRLRPLLDGPGGDKIVPGFASVDCLGALRAQQSGDHERLIASGLPAFETQLGRFLQTEIYPTKQRAMIDGLAIVVEDTRAELRKILTTAQADSGQAEEALARCEQDLAEIDNRRARIALLLDSMKAAVLTTAQSSFRYRCKTLSQSLEGRFAEHRIKKLDSLMGKAGSLVTQGAANEALEILKGIIEDDLEVWASAPADVPGLTRDLAIVFEKGRAALATEFAGIDRSINDIALRISDLETGGALPASSVSMTDRLASMAVGALLGPLGLLGGAMGGWRSTLGATAGLISANLLLVAGASILGIAFPPAVIGALALAGTAGGGLAGGLYQIERRIREKAIEKMRPIVEGLPANDAVLGAITGKLENLLGDEIAAVMGVIDRLIGQQTASLRRLQSVQSATAVERGRVVERAEEAIAALPARDYLTRIAATLRHPTETAA